MGITNEQRRRIAEVEQQERARHQKWKEAVTAGLMKDVGPTYQTVRDNLTTLVAQLEARVCACGCGLEFRVLPGSDVHYATSMCDMTRRGLVYSVNGVRPVSGGHTHTRRKEDAVIRRHLFKEAKTNNEQRKDF